MILRYGNNIVASNGLPVSTHDYTYDTNNYIPVMTSNTTPYPFVASIETNDPIGYDPFWIPGGPGVNYAWHAFKGDSAIGVETHSDYYFILKIKLDKPIKIWQAYYRLRGEYVGQTGYYLSIWNANNTGVDQLLSDVITIPNSPVITHEGYVDLKHTLDEQIPSDVFYIRTQGYGVTNMFHIQFWNFKIYEYR